MVEVAYVGGYNEEGERLMQNKSENEWNPWDLIEGDNGSESRYIKAIESVRKQCKLSDGVYTVEMSPSPCNYDVQGMNGGMMTANATIRRGKKILAKQSLGACDVGEELIATKVSVHAGSNVPAIEKKKAGDYYQ
ncbi:hypothetical protein [Noviherbaspirillum sp.]|uniref:hypothetical protein n=1 Tax=Noviherbaspirillum sp. TaxID=1926288 RepID=UPI0025E4A7F3|nr:hypothetical protein [Noviherbaspirillum sp.]